MAFAVESGAGVELAASMIGRFGVVAAAGRLHGIELLACITVWKYESMMLVLNTSDMLNGFVM